jgi:hypothetical protein
MSKPKPHAPEPAEAAEDRLDEALDETFPASDPIAVDPAVASEEPRKKSKEHGSSHTSAKDKKPR